MGTQNLPLSKTLTPPFSIPKNPFHKFLTLTQFNTPKFHKPISIKSQFPKSPQFSRQNTLRTLAGRSRDKSTGGRIEGNADIRREAKRNARRKSKQLAESLFYRLKNPHKIHADNFTQEQLEMMGLGYDRMVRFMEKDDPNIKHPYDWYKYGQFGPYSWRGVVIGDPIPGRFSDENVTMIGTVGNQEDWEEIEKFDMSADFGKRIEMLDKSVGFRYFWVFIRHPKWRISEFPWQQWTLVSEVVLEASKNQRLDKWSLMGRLGNKTRELITQCAAWMRPDIVYVKRPVYQCRFEPQDDFFKAMTPLLDPSTEQDFLFELKHDDGRVEMVTYFGGLCKLVRANPKAFVDDVVKCYQKMSDEKKSKCLEFLLTNHPIQLLHPYTKEWKSKLEEMEMGCDAPEDDDENDNLGNTEIIDWIEDDGDEGDDYVDGDDEDENNDDDDEQEDNSVIEMEENEDGELGMKEEVTSEDEDENYWNNQFKKALSSNEQMEKLAKRSLEITTERYKEQLKNMEEKKGKDTNIEEEEDGVDHKIDSMRGRRPKVSPEEWKMAGYGPNMRKVKKSKIPPELFLRAAVRPFTYRNLVKEIVLVRHAILDGEIGRKVEA